MAVFHPHSVSCVCGNALTVQLADSINVKRSPDMRDKILKGELHRTACPACKRQMTVERPFYYTDLLRNAIFKVCPRSERHTWKEASSELDRASSYIPQGMSNGNGSNGRILRVIFGMDELREKLLAQDADLDDRLLELLKVLLVYEHPILIRRPRLRLVLDQVTENEFEFVAAYEHDAKRFRLKMPRRIVTELADEPNRMRKWTRSSHQASIYDAPDHWVNMWRWSPQPTALDRLQGYAAQINQGQQIDTNSAPFQQMLAGLPRGAHLPAWAKRDLRTLFEHARTKNLQQLQDTLFEVRFGIELENDWSTNSNNDDIDTLWKLLKDLPDTNVEGNTKIHEILLDVGEGGGVYDPNTFDIFIGSQELSHQEAFEDVVRHEVGHAVHEMHTDLVDGWLAQRFGWRTFGRSNAEIDQWVSLMGGWGNLTNQQRQDVRDALRTALGSGAHWNPGPTPSLPPGHPWYQATFGPRLAFEKTGPNWFLNFQTWHRANGKAFYLNYWYRTFIAVDNATLALVGEMPDSYAAMSHFEFFAELYALYFDLDDPRRPAIPHDVGNWLEQNIGAPEAGAPHPAAPRAKKEWETVVRPH
jgi:hypothetical protein